MERITSMFELSLGALKVWQIFWWELIKIIDPSHSSNQWRFGCTSKGMPPTNIIRQNEYAPTKAYISLRNQYEKNGEILARAWWLFMSFGIPIGEKDVFNAKTEEVWLNFILHPIMDLFNLWCLLWSRFCVCSLHKLPSMKLILILLESFWIFYTICHDQIIL